MHKAPRWTVIESPFYTVFLLIGYTVSGLVLYSADMKPLRAAMFVRNVVGRNTVKVLACPGVGGG